MVDPLPSSDVLPCAACPLVLLNQYLESPLGRLMLVAVDLEYALEAGFQVTLRDLSYLDFCLLRVLSQERARYQEEEIKRSSTKRG
jgi:hypothetical protein